MKITIVGTGYVGLVTGACLSNTGNDVTCLDIDEAKVALLKKGHSPIYEPGLVDLLRRNASRLTFTSDVRRAHAEAEVIFICVGTKADADGSPDLTYVMQAARDVADALTAAPRSGAPRIVVVKSTVPVGTCHRVRDLIRSRTNVPIQIASNPEFLKEGAAVSDFMRPDRVVIGVEDEHSAEVLRDLYEPFVRQGNPILVMDVRSSEMVKYASNAMLAAKISFINEIANLCEYYGADIKWVREGMCADQRIGRQFLHPGLGYGGSCFPKDVQAVVNMGRSVGFDCKLSAAVHAVNEDQRRCFWNKVADHFGPDLSGRTVAFWGVAFKPETDDVREAPAISLMKLALDAGASLRAYDPAAGARLRETLPAVVAAEDMYAALEGADALILCTEWNEFRQPDFDRIGATLRGKVIFDGRNIYRRETMERHGFTYYSVGREPVVAGPAPVRAGTTHPAAR
jgi:UDPglucose 6-dehydrogenase